MTVSVHGEEEEEEGKGDKTFRLSDIEDEEEREEEQEEVEGEVDAELEQLLGTDDVVDPDDNQGEDEYGWEQYGGHWEEGEEEEEFEDEEEWESDEYPAEDEVFENASETMQLLFLLPNPTPYTYCYHSKMTSFKHAYYYLVRHASAVPNMFRPRLVRDPGAPCGPWLPLKPTERSEILCEEGSRGSL